jgi:hypothetical protein
VNHDWLFRGVEAAWAAIHAGNEDGCYRMFRPYDDEPLRTTGTVVAATERCRLGAREWCLLIAIEHPESGAEKYGWEHGRAPMPYDVIKDAMWAAGEPRPNPPQRWSEDVDFERWQAVQRRDGREPFKTIEEYRRWRRRRKEWRADLADRAEAEAKVGFDDLQPA